MWLTPDYLLGRRFKFNVRQKSALPEFTCTGFDPGRGVRVHALDGGKWWLPFHYVRAALKAGVIEESEGTPFVWELNTWPTKQQQTHLGTTLDLNSTSRVRDILRRLRTTLNTRSTSKCRKTKNRARLSPTGNSRNTRNIFVSRSRGAVSRSRTTTPSQRPLTRTSKTR
jgi:hypothetical protein